MKLKFYLKYCYHNKNKARRKTYLKKKCHNTDQNRRHNKPQNTLQGLEDF